MKGEYMIRYNDDIYNAPDFPDMPDDVFENEDGELVSYTSGEAAEKLQVRVRYQFHIPLDQEIHSWKIRKSPMYMSKAADPPWAKVKANGIFYPNNAPKYYDFNPDDDPNLNTI